MVSTSGYKLFSPLKLGENFVLKNRVILSPLTRGRSNLETRVPNDDNVTYYEQRAGAGLIITEATAISEQAFGWYGAPALYTQEHAAGWKKVVDAVHAKDGKIVLQLWHMGRQAHTSFNTKSDLVAPSAIGIEDGHVRNSSGVAVPHEVPRALETQEISDIVEDYRKCAELAKQVGFDGVEIHGANGYLIDEFLQSSTNKRTDKYGGSIENRARFLLEIVDALKTVWSSARIAVRLSPNGVYGQMGSEDNVETYTYVFQQLSKHNLAYLALLDGLGFGYHDKCRVLSVFDAKEHFKGNVFATNSYTRDTAEGVIRSGAADAVCFGRAYISNPDLAERFENDWPLNGDAGHEFWWDALKGAEGYTTYQPYTPKE
ncbi:hypothetical protein Poli38472_010783 [Pythium oligandrum]|uniref:NADH:flavin oxidoreductase/NADH oxidase N-terminal domain-containing protein n=1 Tax=Pythium oligandrum TaxID=41045 RepID=A0A8K1CEA7_PYTOL|nr:hypothetical protein Poli38472_010780 [Pythium oligandrum]TMW61720.1 hypothetical protein Poli38472_010783 [Pythium oligandrum]|eukprot:TMW61717.1 hypothetical protein Poli38472_010780 [Pythium oligandrum]